MLAYRTDEDAARLVAEQLEHETAELRRENAALRTRLGRIEAARDGAIERLADAGPGAGRASARRDRLGVGAVVLLLAGLSLIPLQVELLPYLRLSMATPPLLVFFAAPGALAAFVGFRYRRMSFACRLGHAIGIGIACAALVEAAFGAFG